MLHWTCLAHDTLAFAELLDLPARADGTAVENGGVQPPADTSAVAPRADSANVSCKPLADRSALSTGQCESRGHICYLQTRWPTQGALCLSTSTAGATNITECHPLNLFVNCNTKQCSMRMACLDHTHCAHPLFARTRPCASHRASCNARTCKQEHHCCFDQRCDATRCVCRRRRSRSTRRLCRVRT